MYVFFYVYMYVCMSMYVCMLLACCNVSLFLSSDSASQQPEKKVIRLLQKVVSKGCCCMLLRTKQTLTLQAFCRFLTLVSVLCIVKICNAGILALLLLLRLLRLLFAHAIPACTRCVTWNTGCLRPSIVTCLTVFLLNMRPEVGDVRSERLFL